MHGKSLPQSPKIITLRGTFCVTSSDFFYQDESLTVRVCVCVYDYTYPPAKNHIYTGFSLSLFGIAPQSYRAAASQTVVLNKVLE